MPRSRAPLPDWIKPQLSKLVDAPPQGEGWAHEVKYDGYRLQARLDRGRVRLLTRNGLDWTDKYTLVADAIAALPARTAYLDGELCAFNADGTTSFAELQAATDERRSAGLVYMAFDLLHRDGEDLRRRVLAERKERLQALLAGAPATIRYSDHYVGEGAKFFAAALRHGVEGIVSKRLDALYVSGDRGLWRKAKAYHREDFIIVGFTDPEDRRAPLSSLLLAYYDAESRLRYAGRGAGSIAEPELKRLHARLAPLVVARSPLDAPPTTSSRFGTPLDLDEVRWVRPELVCATRFVAWTADGMLRQALYQGVVDKPAASVRHAPPLRAPTPSASSVAPSRSLPRANIQRLLADAVVPGRGELERYWRAVAPLALPHLARRPLTLVRSVGGTTFFHEGPLPPVPPSVHRLRIEKRSGGEGVRVWIDDLDGLLGLLAMDAVELHPWGARVDDIERPDLLVFDLDPGEGIAPAFLRETALAFRDFLARDGHRSWAKTSGGKGLHLMVPLEGAWDWERARCWSKQTAERFARRDPRYTLSSKRAARPGKLFLDYLRNGRGNTAIGAWSPRACPGFPVSYPLTWREVERGAPFDGFRLEALTRGFSVGAEDAKRRDEQRGGRGGSAEDTEERPSSAASA